MRRLKDYGKPGVPERIMDLNPMMVLVLCDFIQWCEANNAPCVISDAASTPEEDQALRRVSSTHREGRAFDASTRGWTALQKAACIQEFSEKYAGVAALSPKTGEPKLVYLHDAGTGEHLHFQLSRRFAVAS